jgi:phosphomannomutase
MLKGICKYLTKVFGEEAKTKGFAIGYDHRKAGTLNSKRFAELTAAVCVSYGIKVYLYEGFVATPLVPFCIDQKECAAGVMVTASHNPKADNGYKVYWANGCQIIPPHDAEIAASILENLAPWKQYNDLIATLRDSSLVEDPTEEMMSNYFSMMSEKLCRYPQENQTSKLKIAYTAMHGVGHPFTSRSFAAFKLNKYVPVELQLYPDPEFPTVAFPNPEEGKGALQLAMETAEANGCSLILANDPDADRLAVAERDLMTGEWKIFTGNEIGVLLGHWEYTQFMKKNPQADKKKLYFIASTVSSKMLEAIAKKEGLNFVETLTGFKWIGNKTDELRQQGNNKVLFSFEEAIGFCIGDLVKDKDGVCAAAVIAEMASQLYNQNNSVYNHLQQLYTKYGHFVTQNHYVKCDDPKKIIQIFNRLRNDGFYWHTCGDYTIQSIRDLTTGFDSSQRNNQAILPFSSSNQMITYTFSNHCIATLRTSGTEPKLKYYVELAGSGINGDQTREQVKEKLSKQVETIIELMLQPEKNHLEY